MASHGIHGAVDTFDQLPPPARLDLDTAFIVRNPDGAPQGAGLYWVVKTAAGRAWEYLDDADFMEGGTYQAPSGSEDDWDSAPPSSVNDAIARLAAAFRAHTGSPVPQL